MYLQHFGLRHPPLGKDIAEPWDDGALEQLTQRFNWLLQSPGLGLLTGEPGVGKTAALRSLTRALNPHRHLVLYQAETDFGRVDIYRGLARALGLEPSYRRDLPRIRSLGAKAAQLDALFHHRVPRSVKKDGTVSYLGRRFEVPYQLSGKAVRLVVDPHAQRVVGVEDEAGVTRAPPRCGCAIAPSTPRLRRESTHSSADRPALALRRGKAVARHARHAAGVSPGHLQCSAPAAG